MNDLYKSPIDMMMSKTVHEIQAQHEKHILRAVLNVGINVDKEELIKALQYDRGQYDKGYADGVREFAEKVKPILRAMFDLMMDDNEIKCIIPNCKHPSPIPYMNKYCIKKNLAAWENKIDKLAGELGAE